MFAHSFSTYIVGYAHITSNFCIDKIDLHIGTLHGPIFSAQVIFVWAWPIAIPENSSPVHLQLGLAGLTRPQPTLIRF